MIRSTKLAAGVLTAALAAGGAAGLVIGVPAISGAQESTQDDGTTTTAPDATTPDASTPDASTPEAEAPDGRAPADGQAPEGCEDGEAPADSGATTEGTSTAAA